jgi:hypothetical protein
MRGRGEKMHSILKKVSIEAVLGLTLALLFIAIAALKVSLMTFVYQGF